MCVHDFMRKEPWYILNTFLYVALVTAVTKSQTTFGLTYFYLLNVI